MRKKQRGREEEEKKGQSVTERVFTLGRHGYWVPSCLTHHFCTLREFINSIGEHVTTHKVLSFLILKI